MKTLKISALALFSVLSFAACDGDGGTGVTGLGRGQFEGEISGTLDIGLRGDAETGYFISPGVNDLIVLTDLTRGVQVIIYNEEDEFFEGRTSIDDENDFNRRIVAYVEDLETGESYSSVSGVLDLDDVRSGGIEGAALFTAENDLFDGEFITVDVIFNADYNGNVGFSLSPSFSRTEKR